MADKEFLIKESTLIDITNAIRDYSYHQNGIKVANIASEILSACSYARDMGWNSGYSSGWDHAQANIDNQLNDAYTQGKQDGIIEGEAQGEQQADYRWQQKLQNCNLSFSIYSTLGPGEGSETIEFQYITISEDGQIIIQDDSSTGADTTIEYAALEKSIIKTNQTYYTQISTPYNLTKIGETSSHYFYRITR